MNGTNRRGTGPLDRTAVAGAALLSALLVVACHSGAVYEGSACGPADECRIGFVCLRDRCVARPDDGAAPPSDSTDEARVQTDGGAPDSLDPLGASDDADAATPPATTTADVAPGADAASPGDVAADVPSGPDARPLDQAAPAADSPSGPDARPLDQAAPAADVPSGPDARPLDQAAPADAPVVARAGWTLDTPGLGVISGLVTDEVSRSVAGVMVRNGDELAAGWPLLATDQISAGGDFDGDGRDDLLIRNAAGVAVWGVKEIGDTGSRPAILATIAWGEALGPVTVTGGDLASFLADLDGDRRAEWILRDNDEGFTAVVVWSTASSRHVLREVLLPGSKVGAWPAAKEDRIVLVADVTGDGGTDLVIRSATQLGLLHSDSTGQVTGKLLPPLGTQVGGWTLAATDKLLDAGQYDGEGGIDLVVGKERRLSLLTAEPDLRLTFLADIANETSGTAASSEVIGFGDFDGDARRDLVVRTNESIEILQVDRIGRVVPMHRFEFNVANLEGWRVGSDHILLGTPDGDGDGANELVISSPTCCMTWLRRRRDATWTNGGFRAGTILPGGWPYNLADRVAGVGRFDGRPGQEIILRR